MNFQKRSDGRISFSYKGYVYVINDGSDFYLQPTYYHDYFNPKTPLMPIYKGDKGSWTVGDSLIPYTSDSKSEIKSKSKLYNEIIKYLQESEEFNDLTTLNFNQKVKNTKNYFQKLLSK